ncbi:MAG: trigger factor [Sulfurovum sp.]|nr:trigger factor [Sulfurovaceae bacterium]
MEITTKRLDDANVQIDAQIDKSDIEERVNKLAKEAGKQIKVDGFRQGKVPAHVVKKIHGKKLEEDAEGDILKDMFDQGNRDLKISSESIIGQPTFKKFNKTDAGLDISVEVSLRPEFEVDGYSELAPEFDRPIIEDNEIEIKLQEIADSYGTLEKILENRAVKDGDSVLINFVGSIDGIEFDGGSAEDFSLNIGSGQFIPGFEEQLIGLYTSEESTINVTFPEDYHSKELAGKLSKFKVTIIEIQEKNIPAINEDLAVKLIQDEENPTLEMLKKRVSEQIKNEKLSKIYNDDLKPKMVDALVKHFIFALPNNIVEQEIDAKVQAKAQNMSEEELDTYKDNTKKIMELRDSVKEDAEDSVKATFIVDAMARKEKITVSDDEVSQNIYYEAMRSGQNPQEAMKHYQENNLIAAVKMGMIEDKLLGKLLGF